MKTNKTSIIIALAVVSVAFSGCLKNKIHQGEETPEKEDIFKFETTKLCEVNLDFDLNNYSIIAELYKEKPVNDNGEKIAGIEPILRGITDKNGVLKDAMNLDKSIKLVYFYTEYLGLPDMIPIVVTESGINFSVKAAKRSMTRSEIKPGGTYPEDVKLLGGWDNVGMPDNLEPRATLPQGLFYNISQIVPKYVQGTESGALQFLGKGYRTELYIKERTPINMIFVNETASKKNSICYYHYPTGQEPKTVEDVKLIMAFPNLSFPDYNDDGSLKTPGLSSGDNVKLKYWNEEKQLFEDEFPAGTTLALAIMTNSIKNGNISKGVVYYANPTFNITEPENLREHIILLHEKKSGNFIHILEDMPREKVIEGLYPGGDFHDAIMYISAGVPGAIDAGNVPELPEAGTEPDGSITPCHGTLIFEDLWPYEGDYDMNDIVIEYVSAVHRNTNNRTVKIVDEYTVKNIGGTRACGFGYSIKPSDSFIKYVEITPQSDVPTNAKGMEAGQHYSTPSVMIFGNILEQTVGKKYVVTTVFTSPMNHLEVMPPYNPFITILNRNIELHLTNEKPTYLANPEYFGTADDNTDVVNKTNYYVSKNNTYPFAMNLPILNFKVPAEEQSIDEAYERFKDWVTSGGNEENGWWL